MQNPTRRTFVRGVSATAVAGALAGCTGSDGNDGDGGDGGESAPEAVDDYLADVGNYDGTLADETGTDEVTVTVGAEGNDGAFAFDPPAVRIDSGTKVVWEWTGDGGGHNVVATNGAFDSGDPVQDESTTFEHTFESTGEILYLCEPHETLQMKGAVVVR